MANPVAAGLVRWASDWPGITTTPAQLGCLCRPANRPDYYFDSHNPAWPKTTTLQFMMPQSDLSESELRAPVAGELERAELEGRASVSARGWKVAGRDRIARFSPYERATSWEPLRGRNPTFAVGRGQREAFALAVAVLREFRRAYREALERWKKGLRATVFSAGTWLMHQNHVVAIAA